MKLIEAVNVNQAYELGLQHLVEEGVYSTSRNGPVVVAPEPVMTSYVKPTQRVLFSPVRDANPFFHIMEGLWMLHGRRDSGWPTKFNSQMAEYANEEGNYDGAYGFRWRYHFGFDQLITIVEHLNEYPDSRRAVLAMHDPNADLGVDTKDQPCNTHIYFAIRNDELNMTVCCRSNDAIWGAYGANAVHMSMLQEVMAGVLDVGVGKYYQLSNNLHYYTEVPRINECVADRHSENLYAKFGWRPYPMVHCPDDWFEDCARFMREPFGISYKNYWFYYVARPMYLTWVAHKSGAKDEALSWASQIEDLALSYVCNAWLLRRY